MGPHGTANYRAPYVQRGIIAGSVLLAPNDFERYRDGQQRAESAIWYTSSMPGVE